MRSQSRTQLKQVSTHIILSVFSLLISRTFHLCKTETLYPLNSSSQVPSHPIPSNHHSFCFYAWLLQILRISGTTQCLSSCDQLISFSIIQIVASRLGFPRGSAIKNLPAMQEMQFNPWVRKIPRKRKWQPTPVFLPKKFHDQKSLVGYSP